MASKKAPVKKVPVKKTPKGKKPSFLRKDTSRPARDVKPGDMRSQASQGPKKTGVKSPAETRRSISRKQTGTSRPARDVSKGGLRAQYLKGAGESAASRTLGTVLRTGLRVAGPVGALVSMTQPAGTGSDNPTGPLMKGNNMNPTFPKGKGTASQATKKSSGFGKRISESAKFERLRTSRAALTTKSSAGTSEASGATQNRPTTTRPKPMNTKAADYAAMQQGQVKAKAKSAAPSPTPKSRPSQVIPSAPVKRGGLLSRTEREGLSTDRMQRKPKGTLLGFLKKRK